MSTTLTTEQLAEAVARELRDRGLVEPIAVDPQRAAAMLSVSVEQLERWRRTGEGPPFIKYAKKVTYLVEDLRAFALAHRINSTSEQMGGGR